MEEHNAFSKTEKTKDTGENDGKEEKLSASTIIH